MNKNVKTSFLHTQGKSLNHRNCNSNATDMFSFMSVSALASSHIMRKVGSGGALNTLNLTLPLALFRGR